MICTITWVHMHQSAHMQPRSGFLLLLFFQISVTNQVGHFPWVCFIWLSNKKRWKACMVKHSKSDTNNPLIGMWHDSVFSRSVKLTICSTIQDTLWRMFRLRISNVNRCGIAYMYFLVIVEIYVSVFKPALFF